jgi:2-hydroxy-3-oxopropionate reductase
MSGHDAPVRVGFIGLGAMGRPMATNLLKHGFPLLVASRSRAPIEALVAAGAREGETPAAIAAATDIVCIMVPDLRDLDAVLEGGSGLLEGAHPGQVVCDLGTHEPSAMVRIAASLAAKGAEFIDAPVSGGVRGAESASLVIMAGGSVEAIRVALPVLEAMSAKVVRIGDVGGGQVAKACNQLIVGSTIEAVAEALALARAAGVDPVVVRAALLGGFAQSRVLEEHGQRMLDADFHPGARVALHAKDAHIVMELARRLSVPIPGFEPVVEGFDELIRRGRGELDHSALVTLVDPTIHANGAGWN